MYKEIDFSKTGGLFVYQETLDYLQQSYKQTLSAIAANFGDKVIISGCVDAGPNTTDGWICLNGEILPMVGGARLAYVYQEDIITDEQFDDAVPKPVYTAKRLRFTVVSAGNYAWADFARLPIAASGTIKDALNAAKTLFNAIAFEPIVIMSGCETSDLNEGTSVVKIGAGVALINGLYVPVPAYDDGAGAAAPYPVWLDTNGAWATADPGGDTILFDWETSQRYKDVVKRNITGSGEQVMHTLQSEVDTYFDIGTGLGKWKWLGWKLSTLMRSRVPLGYDWRVADGGDDAWDANYTTVGHAGGEKKHTLSNNEFNHSHKMNGIVGDGTSGQGGINPSRNDGGYGNHEDIDDIQPGGKRTIEYNGAATGVITAHENRQPYRVIAYFERL